MNLFSFHLVPWPHLAPPRFVVWTGGIGSVSGSRPAEIPDGGHYLGLERPDIAAEVQGFLVGPA